MDMLTTGIACAKRERVKEITILLENHIDDNKPFY